MLDFGPIYAFWLFSFEMYDGLLGNFPTNNRSIELQLMRKFLRDQSLYDLVHPGQFGDQFEPLLGTLHVGHTGTVREIESENVSSF